MSDNTYEVVVHYKIKFTNKKPVSIKAIIESLQAYERIIHRTGPFIEKSYYGIDVVGIDVFIANLESGSLIEDFVIKYIFKGQDNYDDAKQVFDNIMSDNASLAAVVALGIGLFVGYGIQLSLPENKPAPNITAYNGAIVQLGGTMNLGSDEIRDVLTRVKDKKTLAKEAISAIVPAHLDPNASIEVDGYPQLVIAPAVLSEAPEVYEPPEPSERTATYENVKAEIWASDKESHDKNWAGLVPGVVDKRVRFYLDESIDPNRVHGKRRIMADVTVRSTFMKSTKRYKPKDVTILKIH